jgi:N-acetylmuramoyl-L-alanine amidase
MSSDAMTAPLITPDSTLAVDVVPSPNHGERRGIARPDILLLHYTGMDDAQAALERLCQSGSEVSAHYVVFEDGGIVQCVAEGRRAWHAGASSWEGATDINSHSVGIEIANPGHDGGYPDFPGIQIEAVIALSRDIVARHGIAPHRVLAHSDVAPARKQDPGEKFPWDRLAAAGIGLWIEPEAIASDTTASAADVRQLQADLARYGYGIDSSGHFDQQTRDVVTAFQRHFRPARVDGIADASTATTLARLLAARATLA